MDQQYILNQGDWSCLIAPEFGSNVISLRHRDFSILREPAGMYALQATPVLYGIPLLLPPNRTAGGKFIFDRKAYQLPINDAVHDNHLHGSLHSAPFQVLDRSGNRLKTQLVNHGAQFPFPFQIDITDTLDADGYHRTLEITNTGTSAMPLTLGFHTTFTEPERFSVPIGRRWVTNDAHIPTGELAEMNACQQAYRNGCDPRGQSISGFYTAIGNTAEIGDYSFRVEGFDQWILYNGGGNQGFLCVEPQLGPVNSLAAGCCGRLEPGETAIFKLHLTKA